MTELPGCELTDFDCRLADFEAACQRDGRADVESFLPPADDPGYLDVLVEILRVDLEYGWSAGRPSTVEQYVARFPVLEADADALRAVKFENFRQENLARAAYVRPLRARNVDGDEFGPATAYASIERWRSLLA